MIDDTKFFANRGPTQKSATFFCHLKILKADVVAFIGFAIWRIY